MATNSNWLSGAVFFQLMIQGSITSLRTEFLLPVIRKASFCLRFLGPDRLDLRAANGNPISGLQVSIPQSKPVLIPSDPKYDRCREIFENRTFCHSIVTLSIPTDLLVGSSYLGNAVGQKRGPQTKVVRNTGRSWDRLPETIYLEIERSVLTSATAVPESFFLLLTYKQAGIRLCKVAERFGVLERRDEATEDALFKLMLRLVGGGDNPLLTDDLEDLK